MKCKLIITQVVTTELVVDTQCAEDALEIGNQIIARDMIPLSDYKMKSGSVEVEDHILGQLPTAVLS